MNNNKLALIVSYYLARFNTEGLNRLGFSSFKEAFKETSRILGVKENYVKLRRDEFDPVFPWRRGWQRAMDKQIVKTIEAFQELDEDSVYQIVSEILSNQDYNESEELAQITNLLASDEKVKSSKNQKFILRAPTGTKAENFFIDYHKSTNEPESGELRDTRDMGCGYDFEIFNKESTIYVEVKGLAEVNGGIVFTNKEWRTALASGNNYYLALVRNVETKPQITFIKNPALKLNSTKRIYTTVQIQWSVSSSELSDL